MTDESGFAELKAELDAAVRPGGRVWFVTLVSELNDVNATAPADLLAIDVCSWAAWPEFREMSKSARVRWIRAALIEIDHRPRSTAEGIEEVNHLCHIHVIRFKDIGDAIPAWLLSGKPPNLLHIEVPKRGTCLAYNFAGACVRPLYRTGSVR